MPTVITSNIRPIDRLCIYFFYDPEGIVDDYVVDCIHSMKEHCSELVVVCNGKLTPSGRQRLLSSGATSVYKRPNIGFDVWAYKYAIDKIGWKRLRSFEEVIFMNFTIMGPIYPLSEMFSKMDNRSNIDFWGLTVHHGELYDPWGIMPNDKIPEHLQSHFIAVRKSMLQSPELEKYWANMRPINNYIEAVGYHEAIFTSTFEKLGFKWESYIDTKDLQPLMSYPLMFMPNEVLNNRRCPFFKRKAFFLQIEEYLGCTNGEVAHDTLDFLVKHGYDTRKIFSNINRSCNQYDLRITNKLFYSPSTNLLDESSLDEQIYKTTSKAVMMYANSDISLELLLKYLPKVSKLFDTYIVIDNTLLGEPVKTLLRHHAKLVAPGDYKAYVKLAISLAHKYDLLGFASSYYPRENDHPLLQREVLEHNFRALFETASSARYATSILSNNPHLGLVSSIKPRNLGPDSWSTWDETTYARTRSLLSKLGFAKTLLNAGKPPLAPVCGFFWIKSSVIASQDWEGLGLLRAEISNNKMMDTFIHVLPFAVQSQGMLAATLTSSSDLSSYQVALTHSDTITRLNNLSRADYARLNNTVSYKSNLYWSVGSGFQESKKYIQNLKINDDYSGYVCFEIQKNASSLRFDPVEGSGVACTGVRASVNGVPVVIESVNSIKYNHVDMFITSDPQYSIASTVVRGDVVEIHFDSIFMYSQRDFAPLTEGNMQYGGPLNDILQTIIDSYMTVEKPKRRGLKFPSNSRLRSNLLN